MANNVDMSSRLANEELSPSLLAVLPSDPFEMLNISRLLAVRAFTARVQTLESEARGLKAENSSSKATMKSLETKTKELEASLEDARQKLEKSEEEQVRAIPTKAHQFEIKA